MSPPTMINIGPTISIIRKYIERRSNNHPELIPHIRAMIPEIEHKVKPFASPSLAIIVPKIHIIAKIKSSTLSRLYIPSEWKNNQNKEYPKVTIAPNLQ